MLRRLGAFALGLSCVGGALSARPAQACSPRPPDWVSFAEIVPREGTREVAVDAPLVLRFNLFPASQLAVSKFDLPQTAQEQADLLKVDVTDESTGQPIAGARGGLGWNGTVVTFQPSQPLPANTRVRVAVRVTNLYVRPDDARGATEASAVFTTGSARLAPLTVAPTFNATLERYTAPVLEQTGCGPVESPTSTEPAVRTRIQLPKVSGGLPDAPYFVRTYVTRDVAYDFAFDPGQAATIASDYRYVTAGESPEVVLRLPNDSTLTTVCQISEFQDASGKKLATTPVCLPALRPGAPAEPGGCNVAANNDPAAPLVIIVAWASFAGFLILRRARRRDL
jgi:hypothetical protein